YQNEWLIYVKKITDHNNAQYFKILSEEKDKLIAVKKEKDEEINMLRMEHEENIIDVEEEQKNKYKENYNKLIKEKTDIFDKIILRKCSTNRKELENIKEKSKRSEEEWSQKFSKIDEEKGKLYAMDFKKKKEEMNKIFNQKLARVIKEKEEQHTKDLNAFKEYEEKTHKILALKEEEMKMMCDKEKNIGEVNGCMKMQEAFRNKQYAEIRTNGCVQVITQLDINLICENEQNIIINLITERQGIERSLKRKREEIEKEMPQKRKEELKNNCTIKQNKNIFFIKHIYKILIF
ncbi:unnamed protein product, partial [marine sediment metagenome]